MYWVDERLPLLFLHGLAVLRSAQHHDPTPVRKAYYRNPKVKVQGDSPYSSKVIPVPIAMAALDPRQSCLGHLLGLKALYLNLVIFAVLQALANVTEEVSSFQGKRLLVDRTHQSESRSPLRR